MGNSPQMPANMPITKQRTVRGESVRRLPGSTAGPDLPRFDWVNDPIDSIRISAPWLADGTANYTSVGVVMATAQDVLEFNVMVNGVAVDSGIATGLVVEIIPIAVPVVLNDYIQIEITDVGGGDAQDVSFVLRRNADTGAVPPTPPDFELISFFQDHTNLNGANDIVIDGTLAYLPCHDDGTGRVSVVNISNPASMSLHGTVAHADLLGAFHLVKSGNYLFVTAEQASAVVVIDVSTPSTPVRVATFTHADIINPAGIVKVGNYLFVCDYGSGSVVSINVTTPTSPTHADTEGCGGAFMIAVSGSHAFVTSFDSHSVNAINISNPNALSTTSQLASGPNLGLAGGITIDGSTAFVATIDASPYLTAVNISNPASMTIIASYHNGSLGNAYMLLKDGPFIFWPVEGQSKILAVDVHNLAAMELVATYSASPTVQNSTALAKVGSILFCAVETGDGITALETNL